jgi:prepilin-type N-terminal cleavage/methylation domain-containing protein
LSSPNINPFFNSTEENSMNSAIATRRSEQGFTLVELAIVMIIIGLLIGGILKGQELIANARIASTVAQVKGIDAATTTFRDKYDALPGDMANATTRLPTNACGGGACPNGGDGNNRLSNAPLVVPTGEGIEFFQHLAAADLIGGISFNNPGAWGGIYPEANIAGGFVPGYFGGGALGANGTAPAGHYLSLVLSPTIASADNTLTPNQAQRIDTKLDDGSSDSGSVFSSTVACNGAGGLGYAEGTQTTICDLVIRFQS